MKYRYLKEDFDFFADKLRRGENFTLMRFADGEYSLMLGKPVHSQEGWISQPGISELGKALYNSFRIDDGNVFYGISCPCCDRSAYYWYRTHIGEKKITFSNLWVNANHPRFREMFLSLKRDAVLIANYRAAGHSIGNLNILKHYSIPDQGVPFWENGAKEMIRQIKEDFGPRKNLLYVVSAGPLSEPIIAELYENNPENSYVDFGSSIDMFYRECKTRPYMIPGNVYAERNCIMEDDPEFQLAVSVVLSLYKRPEFLEQQLAAMENQTLKPAEILLLQDGVEEEETVTIPEQLKSRFRKIEVHKENKGVWERFRFARDKASCPFVCVLDDDVLPGSQWLENCHACMMRREALYGSVGIVMRKEDTYPFSHYYRVGYPPDAQYPEALQVDFAGHSWFCRREWLSWLFDAPQSVQKLKYAGEDMAFSRMLQKHGIETWIPPHPRKHPELHGSSKPSTESIAKKECAVSLRKENLERMNTALALLRQDGWRLLCRMHRTRVILLWVELRIRDNRKLLKLYDSIYELARKCRRTIKRLFHE